MREILGACILSAVALQSTPICAAELSSTGKGTQILDTCKIDLTKDVVRTFWRDADGTPLAGFTRVLNSLNLHGERLVCASNAGIYGKDLLPIGLYVENGKVLRRLNTEKKVLAIFTCNRTACSGCPTMEQAYQPQMKFRVTGNK